MTPTTSRTFRFSEAVPFALVCTGLKAYLGNLRLCSLQKDDAEFKFKSDDEGRGEKDEEKGKIEMEMEAARRGKKKGNLLQSCWGFGPSHPSLSL